MIRQNLIKAQGTTIVIHRFLMIVGCADPAQQQELRGGNVLAGNGLCRRRRLCGRALGQNAPDLTSDRLDPPIEGLRHCRHHSQE